MGRQEIDQEKMNKICATHGWPTVPFPAYVSVHAVINGTAGEHKVKGMVESVVRDYPRSFTGTLVDDKVTTFAKFRLDVPIPGIKRGNDVEVIWANFEEVEHIGPIDLMVEGMPL